MIGSASNDIIYGDANKNILIGGDGDDLFNGRAGNDTFYGGDSSLDTSLNDTVTYIDATGGIQIDLGYYGNGDGLASDDGFGNQDRVYGVEHVVGSSNNDVIYGDDNVNSLSGGTGDDVLYGGGGADVLNGGLGSDTADYSNAAGAIDASLIDNEAKNDGDTGERDSLISIENLVGSNYSDLLAGSNAANIIQGLDGDDIISGYDGNDTLYGGDSSGTDTSSNDYLDYSYVTGPLSGGQVGVTVNLTTGTANDAKGGTDTISGFEHITGSDFDDRFIGLNGQNNIIDGGTGIDTIDYGSFTGGVTVDLRNETATDTGGATDTLTSIENAYGTSSDDTLYGSDADNILVGNDDSDVIYAYLGTNAYYGGRINGYDNSGAVDTIRFDSITAGGVTLDIQAGTVVADADGQTSTLENFEIYIATNSNDTIITEDGADDTVNTLGAVSNDLVYASSGNDSYTFGDSAILDYRVVKSNNSGYSTYDVNLVLDMSNATGTVVYRDGGTTLFTDTYNSSGLHTLYGTTGNDTFIGTDGTQELYGEAGDDTFYGSAGNDTFSGGSGSNDMVDYSTQAGITALNVNLDGTNTVSATTSGDGFDTISGIEHVRGTAGNDLIQGDSNANIFYGGGGSDSLFGDGGNDTLYGEAGNDNFYGSNGSDTFYGSTGSDVIIYDSDYGYVNITGLAHVIIDMQAGTASSYSSASGTSGHIKTDTFTGIERAVATDGNDTVTGSSNTDTIDAESGDDLIYSSAGNDVIHGDAGTDTMDYSNDSNITKVVLSILTNASNGIVTYNGSTTYTQTIEFFENIVGSDGDDTFTGNTGTNNIKGGAGNDIIAAYDGLNNVLDGEGGTNTLSFSNGGSGSITLDMTDLSAGYFSFSSANGNYTGTAKNFANINGSAGNDVLTLDDQTNVVHAGSGGDTVYTNGGNDTIYGDAGNDRIWTGDGNNVVYGGGNDDAIYASIGNDTYNGDGGWNTIFYSNNSTTSYVANLDHIETPSTNNNTLTLFMSNGDTYTHTITGDAHVYLSTGDDIVNALFGTGSGSTNAGDGNDYFYYNTTGHSRANGGNGTDTYDARSLGSGITLNGNIVSSGLYQFGSLGISNFETIYTTSYDDEINLVNTGIKTLYAGGGDDTVTYDDTGQTTRVYGEAGLDTYDASGFSTGLTLDGTDTSNGGYAFDTTYISGFETVYTSNNNDTITLSGTDILTLYAGGGDDTVVFDGEGDNNPLRLRGEGGTDIFDGRTSAEGFFLEGYDQNDGGYHLGHVFDKTYVSGFETVYTSDFNDVIFLSDTDIVTLHAGNGDDNVTYDGNDDVTRIYGEGGSDTLNFTSFSGSTDIDGSDTQDGGYNIGDVYVSGFEKVYLNNAGNQVNNLTGTGIEELYTGGGNDTVYYTNDSIYVDAQGGNDILYAFSYGSGLTLDSTDVSNGGYALGNMHIKDFEQVVLTDQDDTIDLTASTGLNQLNAGDGADDITVDMSTINQYSGVIDGGNGNDIAHIQGNVASNVEGSTFAAVFTNVDELDFTGATFDDNAVFTSADHDNITGLSSLTIHVNDLDDITASGSLSTDVTATTKTYHWANGDTLIVTTN